MRVLAIDVGGTHVKVLVSGETEPRKVDSGPRMTPHVMVTDVQRLTSDWQYDAVSIGYPGRVTRAQIAAEPQHLGHGWVGFDFHQAFHRPIKIVNDAAMQALGSYREGCMLFLGLGTGLGSAMVIDGHLAPMELAHLPYKKGRTYEDYVGVRSLERRGKKKWRRHVADVIERLTAALEPDDVVIGGGNAKKLDQLPANARLGDNANAFIGGFRVWESPHQGARVGAIHNDLAIGT